MTRTARHIRLGQYGEQLAAQHLVAGGMVLLERNWRCRQGEIDLVLRDGAVLVFCEVKTRRGVRFGHPLEAVGEAKLARLHWLAAIWQAAHEVRPEDVRLDVVGVLWPSVGDPVIEHVRGVG